MGRADSATKVSWVVVKFIMEGTALKTKNARTLLKDDIPEEKYTRLFLEAQHWDQENKARAIQRLRELIGSTDVRTLREIARYAQLPAEHGRDDDRVEPVRHRRPPVPARDDDNYAEEAPTRRPVKKPRK